MVPAIRNILGGFLFSGDDVYKKAGVLSGGERTRLAVARMLLRPSNTLLLDEPTNHLDLDSKDVLLEALEDYGGTLIFVSHDRYFVEKLATKIIEVGHGAAVVYPGTLRGVPLEQGARGKIRANPAQVPNPKARPKHERPRPKHQRPNAEGQSASAGRRPIPAIPRRREEARTPTARSSSAPPRRSRSGLPIWNHGSRSARRRSRSSRRMMAAPGFYDDREAAKPVIDRHQALMWEVGDLMPSGRRCRSTPPSTIRNVSPNVTALLHSRFLRYDYRFVMQIAPLRGINTSLPHFPPIHRCSARARRLPLPPWFGFRSVELSDAMTSAPPPCSAPRRSTAARGPEPADAFFRHIVAGMRNGVLAITRAGTRGADERRGLPDFWREAARRRPGKAGSPKCSAPIPKSFASAARRFELHLLPNRAETRLRPSGKVIGYTLALVRDDAGEVAGVAMFFKDLTRVEQLEERERLRDRLAAVARWRRPSRTR